MNGTNLPVRFELGNMIIWVLLEVLALGSLILWTTNVAHIVMALNLKRNKAVRLLEKRELIDWLPMNADIRVLPTVSKIVLTLIRIGVTVAVAVSALGIEPGEQYLSSQATTDMVVATDANFSGRSFNDREPDLIQDFAVSACEDVNTISLVKHKAFVSNQSFSCNDGSLFGRKTVLVEVIWHKDTVRQITRGEKVPVNVKLGDKSSSTDQSNATYVEIRSSDGAPIFMFVSRRRLENETFGECAGEREYLVVGNNPNGDIMNHNVAVAYVICEARSTVFLRNTDEMIFLPDLGANQQMILARKVAESLVSIVRDESGRVYEGELRMVTILEEGYNIVILCLAVGNTLLMLVSAVAAKAVTRDVAVDVFSPFSMYKLGSLACCGEERWSALGDGDIVLKGKYDGDVLKVGPAT